MLMLRGHRSPSYEQGARSSDLLLSVRNWPDVVLHIISSLFSTSEKQVLGTHTCFYRICFPARGTRRQFLEQGCGAITFFKTSTGREKSG